jgi:ribosomal protein S18 acetylase RimI-like enzyme
MVIANCEPRDLEAILKLYEAARVLQAERKMVVWPFFENSLMEQEIAEKRQWKLIVNSEMACNWAITFSDKEIWEEKDQNDSVYIHRIATNPAFRGQRFVNTIVDWARNYAREQGKKFVRLDTLGNNTKLIQHYSAAGFNFLGVVQLRDTSKLPLHYQLERDCLLFELEA